MEKVALLLAPQFADWEYGLIAGVGGSYYGLNIRFFAPQKGLLTSAGGLNVKVANSFDEVLQYR
ncbi:MAG: hypothetical protein ACK5LE_07955 [Alphaproteobacteria bacterium]